MYNNWFLSKIARESGVSETAVHYVLTSLIEHITEDLAGGKTVTFTGFGTFYTSPRPAGTVPHGRTGKQVPFPAHRVAAFRAGERLKRAVRTPIEQPVNGDRRRR